MSEIKVGDTVWVRAEMSRAETSNGDQSIWLRKSQPHQGKHITSVLGDDIIPDVPGLPALAAIIAEVGAEAISFAFEDADTALRNWHDGLADEGTAADLRDIELVDASRDILRRLAAALEVK